MTCACCKQEVPAVIVWVSEPIEGRNAVKLALCLPCSEQIDRNEAQPIGMETSEVMTRAEAERRYR